MSVAIFIDTNQFLDLYRIPSGKEVLEALEEQKDYIFISTQVVDEVMRNKLRCAGEFFATQIKEISPGAIVPDHLLGIGDDKVKELRSVLKRASDTRNEIRDLVAGALAQISRSEDDVSKRLAVLFDGAIDPKADELQRARNRRERGNPPGKARDTLGDQITWEQFLTHCKNVGVRRPWIATNDGDYVTKFGTSVLLNSFLHRELTRACCDRMEIRCFDNVMGAIKDFGRNAGVTAKKLPTEEKAKEIEKELQALPHSNSSSLMDVDAVIDLFDHVKGSSLVPLLAQIKGDFLGLKLSNATLPELLSFPERKSTPDKGSS
jgi:hypothetical protein